MKVTLRCMYCGKETSAKGKTFQRAEGLAKLQLENHVDIHHSNKVYRCSKCSYKGISKKYRDVHYYNIHVIQNGYVKSKTN